MHELLVDRLSRGFAASAVTYVQQSISIACYSFLKRVTFARYYVSPFKSDFCLPPLTGNALYRQFIRSGQATNQGCSYTRELSEMWLSDMSVQGHRLMRHVHPVPQCWLLTLALQLKQAMQKLPCCNQKKKAVAVVVVLAATPSSANCTYLAGWFTEPAKHYAFTQSSGQVLRLLCKAGQSETLVTATESLGSMCQDSLLSRPLTEHMLCWLQCSALGYKCSSHEIPLFARGGSSPQPLCCGCNPNNSSCTLLSTD